MIFIHLLSILQHSKFIHKNALDHTRNLLLDGWMQASLNIRWHCRSFEWTSWMDIWEFGQDVAEQSHLEGISEQTAWSWKVCGAQHWTDDYEYVYVRMKTIDASWGDLKMTLDNILNLTSEWAGLLYIVKGYSYCVWTPTQYTSAEYIKMRQRLFTNLC